MKIISVVGARPNFMKIVSFTSAVESHKAWGPDMAHVVLANILQVRPGNLKISGG
jgi:UDP-N-acetylglucosamine 2-epimerase